MKLKYFTIPIIFLALIAPALAELKAYQDPISKNILIVDEATWLDNLFGTYSVVSSNDLMQSVFAFDGTACAPSGTSFDYNNGFGCDVYTCKSYSSGSTVWVITGSKPSCSGSTPAAGTAAVPTGTTTTVNVAVQPSASTTTSNAGAYPKCVAGSSNTKSTGIVISDCLCDNIHVYLNDSYCPNSVTPTSATTTNTGATTTAMPVGVCSEGATRCNNNNVESCERTGQTSYQWTSLQSCGNDKCDSSSGDAICVPAGAAVTYYCYGGVWTANDPGVFRFLYNQKISNLPFEGISCDVFKEAAALPVKTTYYCCEGVGKWSLNSCSGKLLQKIEETTVDRNGASCVMLSGVKNISSTPITTPGALTPNPDGSFSRTPPPPPIKTGCTNQCLPGQTQNSDCTCVAGNQGGGNGGSDSNGTSNPAKVTSYIGINPDGCNVDNLGQCDDTTVLNSECIMGVDVCQPSPDAGYKITCQTNTAIQNRIDNVQQSLIANIYNAARFQLTNQHAQSLCVEGSTTPSSGTSICKIVSPLAIFSITGNKCTDGGIIIGAIILLIVLLAGMGGGKK